MHRDLDPAGAGRAVKAGDALELRVTPDRYLTVRYAGASGDFNPIHIDDEFAKNVGLPGRILHGLWTMAQVARAHTEAAGGPEQLKALGVQFRGMGLLGEEITVTGTVREVADGEPAIAPAGGLGRHQREHRLLGQGEPRRQPRRHPSRGRPAAPAFHRHIRARA